MPATRPTSLSTLASKLINLFAKSQPNDLAALAADLEDVEPMGDLWTAPQSVLNSQTANPRGPAEGVDGASGAARMEAHYGNPTSANAGDGTNRRQAEIAPLAALDEKLELMASLLKALTAYVMKADDFEEDDKDGSSSQEDDDDSFPGGQKAAKSDIATVATMDIGSAMSFLTGRLTAKAAREAAKVEAAAKADRAINLPPDFGPRGRPIRKAVHLEIADTLSDDNSLPLNERIALRLRSNVARMRSEGAIIPDTDLRNSRYGSF
jgi:hypothetical protein